MLCRQPDGRLTAKRAVNSPTAVKSGLAVREALPSAWAKRLTAKSLPSVDFRLTAKQLTADWRADNWFAVVELTAKPLPSAFHVFAVSYG